MSIIGLIAMNSHIIVKRRPLIGAIKDTINQIYCLSMRLLQNGDHLSYN